MGISWSEFWTLNPHILNLKLENYIEKQERELQKQNSLFHLQGMYMADAIMCTVGNALSGKSGKKYKYPDKPYPLNTKQKEQMNEEEMQKQRELFVAKLMAMQTNFELNHKKDNSE